MDNKIYLIEKHKFLLKTDLTLDESEEVSNLLSRLYANDKNTISGEFSSTQIKRFLEIVLEPEEPLPDNFSFGQTKESVQLEVFKDFFLARLEKVASTANVFAGSIKQPLPQ